MHFTIGFLIGYISMYVLPAIIVLAISKRLSLEKAKNILIWCFAIFTLGVVLSRATPGLKGIAVPIAALIYFFVYQAISKRKNNHL